MKKLVLFVTALAITGCASGSAPPSGRYTSAKGLTLSDQVLIKAIKQQDINQFEKARRINFVIERAAERDGE